MTTLHGAGIIAPPIYNFKDWEYFQFDALRYHRLTRPENDMVIDRIATFRSLMSYGVRHYLGGLVVDHPRYETSEGWDDWLDAVSDALMYYDRTIRPSSTAESWAYWYRSKRISMKRFWAGLDGLVSDGSLTASEQRLAFWEAHSWEQKEQLRQLSVRFDPQDPFWSENVSGSPYKLAEQNLCRIATLYQPKVNSSVELKSIIFLLLFSLVPVGPGVALIIEGAKPWGGEPIPAMIIFGALFLAVTVAAWLKVLQILLRDVVYWSKKEMGGFVYPSASGAEDREQLLA